MAENMMEKEPNPKTVKAGDILAKDKPAKPKAEDKSSSASAGSKKKHKMKHTHIEHHEDGTHTVRHTPAGGGEEMSYSRPDMAGVIQGLQQHVGDSAQAQPQADPMQQQQPPDPAAGGAPPAAAAGTPQPGM